MRGAVTRGRPFGRKKRRLPHIGLSTIRRALAKVFRRPRVQGRNAGRHLLLLLRSIKIKPLASYGIGEGRTLYAKGYSRTI